MKKAQVAMSFMMMIGVAFFILFAFSGVFFKQQIEFNKEREQILVSDMAITLQEEINLAARVEDGYIREFTIPNTLDGTYFDIIVYGNELVVNTTKKESSLRIPTIIGNFTKGINMINKTEGIIYVYQ